MESSQFANSQPRFEAIEQLHTQGATCDTFRVKLYGKLHFLKRLKPEYAHDIRYQETLRKEFETGYRLEHPSIVRYITLDSDSILMEYVDGETLTERLSSTPDYFKHRKNADKFLRQLLDGVAYLHTHQVLHLDLKPDNILLTRINNDVKLVDLGCCYTDTFVDTQGFTSRFAAPEQLSAGAVDARTDIYAIGKILELLPHRPVYDKVIARCTQHDPADRYQSVADMQHALFPKQRPALWPLLLILVAVLTLGYFLLAGRKQESTGVVANPQMENRMPQTENRVEKSETIQVREQQQPVDQKEARAAIIASHQASPEFLGPIKSELSEEEKEFLEQPHLHIATSEEFICYKHQLDEYYSEVNAFLDDTTNFQNYPSHIAYQRQYQSVLRSALERIEADEWFHPLYKSPMNPVCSYTRAYKAEIEHRAFLNGNKLP